MESIVPHVVAEPRPEKSARRISAAAMLSVTIHLALVGYLWSAQPWNRRPFHLAGGKGSPPLSASFERPQPTDEAIVERVLPTQVRVEPDHAHVDKQMFVPVPHVDRPALEPVEKQIEPHDHPHPHPHVHEPPDVQSLTKPLGSTAPGSVASAASAAQSVGHDETLPSLVFNPPPTYPSEARRAGLQGTVTLRVVVRSDGRVAAVEIFESFTHARFTAPDPADPTLGDYIPGAIGSVVTSGPTVMLTDHWVWGLRLRYFGTRPLDENNTVRSNYTTLFNMHVGYNTKRFRASVDFLNLFNSFDQDITYFYESRLPGEPPGGVADRHFHPIEPFGARFNLQWMF